MRLRVLDFGLVSALRSPPADPEASEAVPGTNPSAVDVEG